MASYQIGGAVAKSLLFPAIGPLGAATLRLGFGAILMMALTRPWRAWPRRAPMLLLLGLGLATAGVMLMFYQALDRLPLGVAIALQFLGPLAIAVFGSRRPTDLIWAAMAAGGVWCLTGFHLAHASIDPVGVAWALGAAACWAGYIVCGRAASAAFGKSTGALAIGIAALVVAPLGVLHSGSLLLSPALMPLALLMALFSTAVPVSLEFYALPRLPARTFAVFMSLEPAFAVLSGLLILNERLGAIQVGGVVLVIVAAAGAAQWSTAREPADVQLSLADAPPN